MKTDYDNAVQMTPEYFETLKQKEIIPTKIVFLSYIWRFPILLVTYPYEPYSKDKRTTDNQRLLRMGEI